MIYSYPIGFPRQKLKLLTEIRDLLTEVGINYEEADSIFHVKKIASMKLFHEMEKGLLWLHDQQQH